jgi:putative Mg2+ transporter-C (MgtC) family protein
LKVDWSVFGDAGRLVVAALLAGAVGLEREVHFKAAGFRTHMLVGLGSALFTVLSINAFGPSTDPGRVAAQIVTGIGFLGAGAIFKEGATVKGLTTAAGLWTVAAIGMAAGAGSILLAVVATAVVLAVMFGLRVIERILRSRLGPNQVTIEVLLHDASSFSKVWKTVTRIDQSAQDVTFQRHGSVGGLLRVETHADKAETLVELLTTQEGVIEAEVIA